MPKLVNQAQCTVRLLAIAAQASYRLKKDNIIDPEYSSEYGQTITDIGEHGYAITDAIAPKGSKGTGTTPIAAAVLTPQDPNAPIIISFRGTKTGGDVLSDIRLGTVGVVGKEFRDAAFEYYQKVRAEHPNREIILTGHSLGGHLAQYVATKAYNTAYKTDPTLLSNPVVQVRTFNTAPISTTHSAVFDKNPGLKAQFVNYRLSSDVVSDLPMQSYTGNTFIFPCEKGALASHPMGAVMKYLPSEILDQPVGRTNDASKQHNMLIELVNGTQRSYQCHVDGQYFSRFRAGSKNLSKMDEEFPKVVELLQQKKYDEAISILTELKGKLDGTKSTGIVDVLIKSTVAVKAIQQKMELATPDSAVVDAQKQMKSALSEMTAQHRSSASKEAPEPAALKEIAETEQPREESSLGLS